MLRSLLLAATLLAPVPALSQGQAGPYLAARIAGFSNDYQAAGTFYRRLLRGREDNPRVLENAMVIYSVLGDFDAASEVADRLDRTGGTSQFTSSARMVSTLLAEDWAGAEALLDEGDVAGPLLDGLLTAWIRVAQEGADVIPEAFAVFEEDEALAALAHQHEAYAEAMVGNFERAAEIMSGDAYGPLNGTNRGLEAHAQVLVELDRRDDAMDLLQQVNAVTDSPALRDLQLQLEAGAPIEFDLIKSPLEGMAEAYYIFAALLANNTSVTFNLLNVQAAVALRPGHVESLILGAELLESQNQFDLAGGLLARIPVDDPAFFGAEIERAQILEASDREDEAIETLADLTEAEPNELSVWTSYADALRRQERFDEAVVAYDAAIDLLPEVATRNWVLFYARGIAHERSGFWTEAESDFRRALELNPENPDVLNYLGYGLVEERVNLDEALDMIERAVDARPDDGYITDSLGWALYRLGRTDEAVAPMERAVSLRPLDPLINDHLGDVLWATGRKREARFQWRRALSLDPEEEEDRIRRKLAVGLDMVLEEEGGVGAVAAPAGGVPADETPESEAPADDAPADDAPIDETPEGE